MFPGEPYDYIQNAISNIHKIVKNIQTVCTILPPPPKAIPAFSFKIHRLEGKPFVTLSLRTTELYLHSYALMDCKWAALLYFTLLYCTL